MSKKHANRTKYYHKHKYPKLSKNIGIDSKQRVEWLHRKFMRDVVVFTIYAALGLLLITMISVSFE